MKTAWVCVQEWDRGVGGWFDLVRHERLLGESSTGPCSQVEIYSHSEDHYCWPCLAWESQSKQRPNKSTLTSPVVPGSWSSHAAPTRRAGLIHTTCSPQRIPVESDLADSLYADAQGRLIAPLNASPQPVCLYSHSGLCLHERYRAVKREHA